MKPTKRIKGKRPKTERQCRREDRKLFHLIRGRHWQNDADSKTTLHPMTLLWCEVWEEHYPRSSMYEAFAVFA